MSLKTTALADATALYSKQKRAMSGLYNAAGDVSGVAAGLQGAGNGLLGQYNDNFSGLVSSMAGKAEMPLSDYVNPAANDVAGNFDRSRGIMGREMARRGVNVNSGRFAGLLANLSRNEAAARAGAMTAARITGQRENFGRGIQASQLGLNVANIGIGAQQAAGGLYGQAGGLMGQAAGQYGNAANEAGQFAGQESMADQLAALLQPAQADADGRTESLRDLGGGLGLLRMTRGSTSGGTVVRTSAKASNSGARKVSQQLGYNPYGN